MKNPKPKLLMKKTKPKPRPRPKPSTRYATPRRPPPPSRAGAPTRQLRSADSRARRTKLRCECRGAPLRGRRRRPQARRTAPRRTRRRPAPQSLAGRVTFRAALLSTAHAPPLPYKVDTSRPSLRTNWTRLVRPRAARQVLRALGASTAVGRGAPDARALGAAPRGAARRPGLRARERSDPGGAAGRRGGRGGGRARDCT